jgi:transcription elongation factor GreB
LIDDERPKVVEIVHWAASNGDRSENGDYLYGKKRLREIDRRIRFLTKRLEIAEVVDPMVHHGSDQVFFGATVTYAEASGTERTVTILGIDEADSLQGQVSWVSPIARTLLKSREGDELKLLTPSGVLDIEVLQVSCKRPAIPSGTDTPDLRASCPLHRSWTHVHQQPTPPARPWSPHLQPRVQSPAGCRLPHSRHVGRLCRSKPWHQPQHPAPLAA